jgi:hypothetical protein
MTIERGEPWGRRVPRPDGLVTVDGDAAVAAAVTAPGHAPVGVRTGDLARSLGVVGPDAHDVQAGSDMVNELPIDLLAVSLDGAEPITACAHVIARSPWNRGHWWRGPILAVMNAEFVGDWDVAPRGHPNDGRVETFVVDPAMTVRQRLSARRRLRTATHVPHPQITVRSVRAESWTFPDALEVTVDGRRAGRARTIEVVVDPDAAVVYA